MTNSRLPAKFRHGHFNSAGFSLVEMLVGVTIALIGIVIMFQVMENADARKRTTGSGGDAQIAGSIAMHILERDVKLAGNGFGGTGAATGCLVSAHETSHPTAAPRGAFSFQLLPAFIDDGLAGAPDQLVVLYGASPMASSGYPFDASTTTSKKLIANTSRGGLMRGDLAVVVDTTGGGACSLIELTDNTHIDQLTIAHAPGAYNNAQGQAAVARFNDPAGFSVTRGLIFSLGERNSPRRNIWQITNGRTLTVTDALSNGGATEIGDGIVNLQAEYGLDTTGDFQVDTWQATAPANWSQIIAIRVGLLARSQQYERVNVTTAAPAWAGGSFVMANLDGTADTNPDDPNDWRHYRYRVYEVTVPLRNVIWGITP